MTARTVQLVECPRDAMQGWPTLIPTETKKAYIKQLLQVGFHTLDCLSFVSSKAIPQMADSHEIAQMLDTMESKSRILAIVANMRGAEDAIGYACIDDLGYPFSISPTFQHKNANSSVGESFSRLRMIQEKAQAAGKHVVVYISMAFGNPYDDDYSPQMVVDWIGKIAALGVNTFSLADTVGVATPEEVGRLCTSVLPAFPNSTVGVHLHSTPPLQAAKLAAALDAGCTRFDHALGGFGGCPMAGNELVGNMDTMSLLHWMQGQPVTLSVNTEALQASAAMAATIFV